MVRKLRCSVCGYRFIPTADERYTVTTPKPTGIAAFSGNSSPSPTLRDAFDCPVCGCQKVVQVRLDVYTEDKEEQA